MEVKATQQDGVGTALDRLLVQLEQLVIDECVPGARLPAESELALRYGVSRITVREALKVLAGRDLVDMGAGRRAVVKAPSASTLAQYLDVAIRRDSGASLELNEIRSALEVQSATLAAQHINDDSRAQLAEAIEEMSRAADAFIHGGPEIDYHHADIMFHERLAVASTNEMLSLVLLSLEEALRSTFTKSFRGHLLLGKPIEHGLSLHRRVFEKVSAGDTRGAAAAMRETLRDSNRNIRATYRLPQRKDSARA